MRPVLSPASRSLWRDAETLQLGGPGPGALVLAGLDPTARAVLALLDGTRDLPGVERAAVQAGCSLPRTRELLALLTGAGLVVDAEERWPGRLDVAERDRLRGDVASLCAVHAGAGLAALRRRDEARVLVVGAGRVGAPLAGLLAAAGVGTVDVADDGPVRPTDAAVGGLGPRDLGRSRGDAARGHVREAAPSAAPGARSGPVRRPDVVVLAPPDTLDDDQAGVLLRDGVPHLLAEVRGAVGVVGPFVLPGSSACLRCRDLARTDRDPGWPAVAVQLSRPPRAPAACDSVLAAAVSAQAALQVLQLVDGATPASVGGALELALPDWRWRRRSWQPHPDCACRWEAGG